MADFFVGRLKSSIFRNPVFLICLSVYLLHSALVKIGFSFPLSQFYLDDLLCMPLVLAVTLFIQRTLFYRPAAYVFTLYQVILAVVYFSVAFEGVLPLFMPRYTADIFDVVAYALGGFIYYRFINQPDTLN